MNWPRLGTTWARPSVRTIYDEEGPVHHASAPLEGAKGGRGAARELYLAANRKSDTASAFAATVTSFSKVPKASCQAMSL